MVLGNQIVMDVSRLIPRDQNCRDLGLAQNNEGIVCDMEITNCVVIKSCKRM